MEKSPLGSFCLAENTRMGREVSEYKYKGI
jgi:hypothetical protein